MDLELTPEQMELESIARQVLDDHSPPSLARDYLEGHGDASRLWREMAKGGWYLVGADPDDPFGVPGLCLLANECGAHVAPTLLVDTALAVRLARPALARGRRSEQLDKLAAGELTVSLAAIEPSVDWRLDRLTTVAKAHGDEFRLSGVKLDVHHASTADALLVPADIGGSIGVFLVDSGTIGLEVTDEGALDPSSAPLRVTFSDVVVGATDALLGENLGGDLASAFSIGAAATAAEGIGAASGALDLAIEYSQNRKQFGRPIGSFQALQHLMADAHVLRETAWSTVLYAAAALDEGTDDAFEAITIAKAYASRAMRCVVEAALQVFGGVAFAWEHDIHLFQRRVLECERRFGDTIHHERDIANALAARIRP